MGDSGLRRRRDDLGRLGLATGEQGPGTFDLRPVTVQSDQELAGLDLGLVANGLVLRDAQADECPRQPAERGPGQGAFEAAEQGRRQRPGDHDWADARQDQERGPDQYPEETARPATALAPFLATGP